MGTVTDPRRAGVATVSRAVVAAAADLLTGLERAVVGDANVRTARGNAWEAIQADRARARARAEMARSVAKLLADRRTATRLKPSGVEETSGTGNRPTQPATAAASRPQPATAAAPKRRAAVTAN